MLTLKKLMTLAKKLAVTPTDLNTNKERVYKTELTGSFRQPMQPERYNTGFEKQVNKGH